MKKQERFRIYLNHLREKVRDRSLKLKGLDSNTVRFVRHAVKIIEEATDLNHLAIMKQV